MALIVQKFGGSTVANIEKICRVAEKIHAATTNGDQIVVVISAMFGETDRLDSLAHQISTNPDPRELDVLLATGEQVNIALLAIALLQRGCKARSYTGLQAKIHTDSAYTKARIISIDTASLLADLKQGIVTVVAGFQGVDQHGNITTLGRGGSDTTAVALAAALKADECQIYTDVDGVFTVDPRVVQNAGKMPEVRFEEMIELSSLGAKVLQLRSVEFAGHYKVPLRVLSGFASDGGTLITYDTAVTDTTVVAATTVGTIATDPSSVDHTDFTQPVLTSNPAPTRITPTRTTTLARTEQNLNYKVVSGITYSRHEALLSIDIPSLQLATKKEIISKILAKLGEANIEVDMLIKNIAVDGDAEVVFNVPGRKLNHAQVIIDEVVSALSSEAASIVVDEQVAKISMVGIGLRSHPWVTGRLFQVCANAGIDIKLVTTSEIKVSALVDEKDLERTVKLLHQTFWL